MAFVLDPAGARGDARAGGKAHGLAALAAAGFSVPEWFVLTPEAAEKGDPRALRPVAEEELRRAVDRLSPGGEPLAVRSSAEDEDGARYSMAGQLDSFLFVPPEEVPRAVVRVWRSASAPRVRAYRAWAGREADRPPAVIVQRMVHPHASGVAMSVDPTTGATEAVVAAVLGLGTALVSGETDADTYRVAQDGRIVERIVAHKAVAHRHDPAAEGWVRADLLGDEQARTEALAEEEVLAVAGAARRAEEALGAPQDVEWALEDGRLYLLQARPITGLTARSSTLRLWDNANIVESYGGVTTPLTFSFARHAYEEVYRRFCRTMRVPEAAIAAHGGDFRSMIGLIRGRVYYDLLSWYRLLSIVPGFRYTRRFMEQMMGVKRSLSDKLVAGVTSGGRWRRAVDALRMLRALAKLVSGHIRIGRRVAAFREHVGTTLSSGAADLDGLDADGLVAQYRDIERDLLGRWDVPLLNDFLTMLFFGILRRQTAKWGDERSGSLLNDLLRDETPTIGGEAVARMRAMAAMVAHDPVLVRALSKGPREEAEHAIEAVPELRRRYRAYLDDFGDRCVEELKLESPTLREDPLPLLRAIGGLAARRPGEGHVATGARATATLTRDDSTATGRFRAALRLHPVRRLMLRWVLRHARARIRDRENLRFERTRVFGRVRRIFRALGCQFAEAGLLDAPDDVFFLEIDEVLGTVEGTTSTTDLRGLAAVRRAEFEGHAAAGSPGERFETRGAVHLSPAGHRPGAGAPAGRNRLQGLGACTGVVRGRARLVRHPNTTRLDPGDILVAERTDPGWVVLFATAAGVITERGSLLSHSAIVAREMGIPTIVAASGVTDWLRDGQWIEMNGATGTVERIPAPRGPRVPKTRAGRSPGDEAAGG